MKDFFFISFLILIFASCSNDTPQEEIQQDQPNSVQGRRTVLVYMAAQNSLGDAPYYHRQDSVEIMNGRQFIDSNDRMLFFIDDNQAPRLYRVTRNTPRPLLIKQWDKDFCSTDPKQFEEVLNYVRQTVPSDEFGLVMWSHADGWIPATDKDYDKYTEKSIRNRHNGLHTFSFGIDSGPDGYLSNKGANMEITDLASSIENAGLHCKFIFFDACLMQNLEVAYALRHVTDYVVAAPMSTPAPGSYYTHDIEKGFFAQDPGLIAQTYLADVQSPALSSSYYDYGLCISAIRTDRMENLAKTLKEAIPHSKLMKRTSPKMVLADDYSTDVRPVLYYQAFCSNYFYRPHNYDALQALRCILPSEYYLKVKEALYEAITTYGSTENFWIGPGYNDFQNVPVQTGDFCGVSMFIPQDVYTQVAQNKKYNDWNKEFQNTEWYKAVGFEVTGW